jgi:hypothetical protein
MTLSRIVMRLARNPGTEFAGGDDHRGYALTAPLTGDGHLDEGAVIRESRDTRLQGEQLSLQRRGYRATFIVARGDLPGGLTSIGYEAGGPRAGPLTVAILKMKSHEEVVHRDVRRLVRRNGGI